MVRIKVIPERLEDLAGRMSDTATQLRDLESRLGYALARLDWQVRQRTNIEGQVHAARRQARALAEEAERLAQFLSERAQAFRQADEEGALRLSEVVRTYISLTSVLAPASMSTLPVISSIPSSIWDKLPGVLKKALEKVLEKSVFEHKQIEAQIELIKRMQVDSKGILRVFGSRKLKELAGVSPYLTRIGPKKLTGHLLREALREECKLSFSPLANLQTAVTLIPTVVKDYRTYAGQGWTAVASAILIDSAVHILTSKVFQLSSAALFSAFLTPVLGPLAPIAPMVGYIIGGFVGSLVGSYVSDWLLSTPQAGWLREQGRQSLEMSSQAIVTAVQNALNAVTVPQRSGEKAYAQ
jgi:uncharacterized protein YukE